MTPTAKNQLQDTAGDYVYDAAGNLIQPGPIGGPYVFDAENRLISAGGMAYLYDGDGKRVGKAPASTPTQPNYLYWYGMGSQILEETDGTGNYLFDDYYFNGMLLARGESDNWVDHFFADALGNVRCVYGDNDPDGGASDYYPFGGERPIPYGCPSSGTTPGVNVPFKFTGKERDSESGLDNFGARYDSSSMGRFMSPDPMGGHLLDPQTLNRYSYVRNNPLNLTDPTGLDFYLQCTDEKHNGCTQVQIDPNNKNKTWVQAGENGAAKIITSDSIRAGDNTATVSENGVTINGNSQGIYFDNAASHTTDANGKDVNNNPIDLAGSGALRDFSFTINGNCSGTCLSSGTWSYPGSLEDARDTLYSRHSFSFPGEDEWADLGNGAHPYSTQHRFGSSSTCLFLTCTNSPHLSVPNSWVPVPKDTVPQGFHVDAHGDMYHHGQDVKRQGVE